MNRKDPKIMLLLRESGELSAREESALRDRLAKDAELRAVEDVYQRTCRLTHTVDSEAEIPAATMAAIRLAGRRYGDSARRSGRGATQHFARVWRPALYAAAAAILLLLSGTLIWQRILPSDSYQVHHVWEAEWDGRLEAQLNELDQLVTTTLLEYAEALDAERDVDSIANELLMMKEMNI